MEQNKVLLLDGGLSNELNNHLEFDVHKEKLWTAKAISSDPKAVIATHLSYLEAGADIIETASYQATLEGFKEFMNVNETDAKKCIKDSVTLAKSAVETFQASKDFDGRRPCPLVAGSIGPYGVFLCDGSEYSGSYMNSITKSQIEAMHLPRIMALVDGGADLLAIETMPCLKEVKIILDLVQQHTPALKVWVSFSIKEGNPSLTAFGDTMEEAYQTVAAYSQVMAFGINCCAPSDVETFIKNVKGYESSRSLKIIVYPNAGQQWVPGQGWINIPVPTLDSYVENWMALGVNIIGGCCQVGTDQIKKSRLVIDTFNNNATH